MSLRATFVYFVCFFFFQAEDGIRDYKVTGVQTCALPISHSAVQTQHLTRHRSPSRNSVVRCAAKSLGAPRADALSATMQRASVFSATSRALRGRLVRAETARHRSTTKVAKWCRVATNEGEPGRARHAIIIRGSSVRVRPPLLRAVPRRTALFFPLATSGGPHSRRHFRGVSPPWGFAMRYIVMQAVAVGAAVALTACTEPPAPAPSAPHLSFAAVRPPAVFVVDASNGGGDTAAHG